MCKWRCLIPQPIFYKNISSVIKISFLIFKNQVMDRDFNSSTQVSKDGVSATVPNVGTRSFTFMSLKVCHHCNRHICLRVTSFQSENISRLTAINSAQHQDILDPHTETRTLASKSLISLKLSSEMSEIHETANEDSNSKVVKCARFKKISSN